MAARKLALVTFVLLAAAAACTRKPVVTVPTVTTPKFPDFVRPSVPPTFANSAAAAGEERGWAFLQAGDLKNAEREFSGVLRLMPSFYPADGISRCRMASSCARVLASSRR